MSFYAACLLVCLLGISCGAVNLIWKDDSSPFDKRLNVHKLIMPDVAKALNVRKKNLKLRSIGFNEEKDTVIYFIYEILTKKKNKGDTEVKEFVFARPTLDKDSLALVCERPTKDPKAKEKETPKKVELTVDCSFKMSITLPGIKEKAAAHATAKEEPGQALDIPEARGLKRVARLIELISDMGLFDTLGGCLLFGIPIILAIIVLILIP